MTLVIADRVKETTTTTGTGAVTLAGATTGFQSFAIVGNANTTYYTIADQSGGNWEVGIGTYTSSTTSLSRDTVLSSSNSNALVNFTAGTKDVFVTYPSSRAVYASGAVLVGGNSSVLPVVSGGTGQTTANTAFNALAPSQASANGQYLTSNGTNTSWATVAAGATLSNDTATATNLYPLFAAATTGTPATVYTSNAKYLYKPSTGELSITTPIATNGLVVNSATVAASYTIATGNNAMSAGPITVNTGISVTVSSGQRWVVL